MHKKNTNQHFFKSQNNIDSVSFTHTAKNQNQLFLNKNTSPTSNIVEKRNTTFTAKTDSPYEWKWVRDGI